jgi:ATP-dependent Clp protease ATP-binding subunit ClpA
MSPEFIGRFNMVVAPSPLNGEQRVSIGLMMIDKLAQMHGIDIVAPQAGLEQLAAICDEQIKELGVRRARHWLENLIEDSFIEAANERHLQAVAADWDGTALILSRHR